MKFEQLVTYNNHDDIEGVLNFRLEDLVSFYCIKDSKYARLRLRSNHQAAYTVLYSDLKAIVDK